MRRSLAVVVALALAVAACGKGGDEETGNAAEGSVKTGPGATADTITLGYLPDLSGVFAPNGKSMMEGAKLYWDAKNQAGGICGRQRAQRLPRGERARGEERFSAAGYHRVGAAAENRAHRLAQRHC